MAATPMPSAPTSACGAPARDNVAPMTSLVERLGHPAGSRALIISCDDLGSCHAANLGVYTALHDGVATCTSLMVPAPWARHAVDGARPGDDAAVLAADPIVPLAARSLSSSLAKAEQGATADFAGCWRAVVAAANPAPEVIEELVAAAEAANLPTEFIEALTAKNE